MDNNITAINNIEQESFSDILRVEGINAKGFGTIPKLVMQDARLTTDAKCIYAYFCSYAGAGNQAFPSVKLILSHLGMSKTTYYKHFSLLKKYGYIKTNQIKKSGRFSKTIYTLCTNPTFNSEEEAEEPCPKIQDTEKEDSPCPKIQYTKKQDTEKQDTNNWDSNINNNIINNNYNNQSIYPTEDNNKSDDIESKLKYEKSNFRSRDKGDTIVNQKVKKRNYNNQKDRWTKTRVMNNEIYQEVISNCCIDGLDAAYKVIVLKILRDFFWDIENKSRVEIGEYSIPIAQFFEEIKKLNYFVIFHAIQKFEQANREKTIKNPASYLRTCIYNSINQMDLEVESDCVRLGLI